jgi:hypothetical protein
VGTCAPRIYTNVRDGHFIVPRASPLANAITEKKFRGAGAGVKETWTMICLILRWHHRHNSGRPPVTYRTQCGMPLEHEV